MTDDITRRDALKIAAAAGAIVALPALAEAQWSPPEPQRFHDLADVRDQIQVIVDDLDVEAVFSNAQYLQLFKPTPVPHSECKDCEAKLRKGISVVNGGFTFHVAHREIGLGYTITRKAIQSSAWIGEAKATLLGLVKVFKELREDRAAHIINTGWLYDPNVGGGDGKPLFSAHHPVEDAVFANSFGHSTQLTFDSAIDAMRAIATNFVDAANIKIKARGEKLIVPVMQMDAAEQLLRSDGNQETSYGVCDYLTDQNNWFIKTNIDGLIFSEYQPLKITVEMDTVTDNILVMGHEINGFGYTDPRAIFGVGGASAESIALAWTQFNAAQKRYGLT